MSPTEDKTWFEGRIERRAAAERVQREASAQQALDDAQLAQAMDRIADARLAREIGGALRSAGIGAIDRSAQIAQQRRVTALIESDRAYRTKVDMQQRAELEIREGVFVNIVDSVVEPTEEWLSKGKVRRFIPKQPDKTVRTISTVRRVVTPMIERMMMAGKIDDDQYLACRWYRSIYEQAGITGRFKSSNLGVGSGSPSSAAMAQHPMAQHEHEAEARNCFRDARASIYPRFVTVFDLVVLNDYSLRQASLLARRDNSRLRANFNKACDALVCHARSIGIKLTERRRDDDS